MVSSERCMESTRIHHDRIVLSNWYIWVIDRSWAVVGWPQCLKKLSGREEDGVVRSCTIITFLGRCKGETGKRYYLNPVASNTDSGIDFRKLTVFFMLTQGKKCLIKRIPQREIHKKISLNHLTRKTLLGHIFLEIEAKVCMPKNLSPFSKLSCKNIYEVNEIWIWVSTYQAQFYKTEIIY